MAEIIVTAVLGKVIETLTSTVLERLNRYKGIHQSLEKWERWLSQIQVVLLDAAQKEIVDEPVKRWLDGLRDLAYDIDDALDDMATKAMHLQFTDESGGNIIKVRKIIPTCRTSFSQSTRMHDRLNKITIKLQNLTEEKNTLGLIVKDGKSKETDGRLETSLVDASSIVGRQGDKEALLQKLLRDDPSNKNFTVVPIIGMGGIGKTTLARLLYNDPQVKDNFHLHAWVCVSVEFDVLKITNIIFRSLTTEKNQEFKDLDKLQVALQKILSEKRFLLVLDDVWTVSHATWELLLRPFLVGASGSKIIMTTRKLKLVTQLCSDQPYHPKLLSDDEALALFCQNALDKSNFDSHPSLKQHGEAIVKKCDGLPLALIALGRSLSTKANEEEWEERLNSKIWELPEENEIIPALRLSYHDLPAHLKQLFAYCSLFPKDYVFDKDELVLLWMAEGFLPHPSGTNTSHQQSIESVGRKYFEELLSRSFFLQASNEESLYVMHDLMNDLATFVAGDFFLRLNDETDADDTYTALKKYRHMSFARQEYEVYGKFKVFQKANNLRTLLAVSVKVKESWERYNLSNKILVELLLELPLLRVLNLSDYEISEIPESIGSLKHLRYLNLSQTCITHLPEQVGDLYNLQTILMRGCQNLMKLPHTFSKLKNLRHFDISDTPVLEKIPFGIGELKSLQTMSKVIIEGSNGFAITELKNLKDLHGRLSIKQLDKIENAMDAKEADLFKKKELNELEMEWGDVLDGARNAALEGEVLNMLKPHHGKLRKLTIVSYGGIEFPSWVGDPSFHRLEHVTIRGCEKCISLPPLGQLSSLKELFVEGMYAVKAIGCDLLGDANHCGGVAFPSLEILSFKDMQGWEVWSINIRALPCIRELRIIGCHDLVEASVEALPSLRVLEIGGCGYGVLRSMVCAASSVTKLKIENISGLTYLDTGVIEFLGAIQDLEIRECDELRYMWDLKDEACKIQVNLRKLVVYGCSNLVGLGNKKDVNCWRSLTSLREIKMEKCKKLEGFSCPNNIEELELVGCGSITSISFPTGGQKLKRLSISDCVKLPETCLNNNFFSLERLGIDGWVNLKSFPDLSCFLHLTHLWISDCKNLKSFPDDRLPTLTSLIWLVIRDCPSMKECGFWPPNLSTLWIGGLKKPITKWGQQNFPISLDSLRLLGAGSGDVDVVSGSQLSHLLPSSLITLQITQFEKLESLSVGLQHLTSLQHLFIGGCPMIRDLPETLLPQLLILFINGCPKLKERCSRSRSRSRRGSYWPRISHIPSIHIDRKSCA